MLSASSPSHWLNRKYCGYTWKCFSELFLLFMSSSFHLLLVIRAKPYNYVLVFRLQIILKSIISLYTQKRPVRQVGRDYADVKIVPDG